VTATSLGGQDHERELLGGFLDWYRAVVQRKVEDLTLEEASRVRTPSGVSLLGIVRHLGCVERGWFRSRFAGEEVELAGGSDNSADFRLGLEDTVASVLAGYQDEIEHSRRIAARASLDDVSVYEHRIYGGVTLRWILVHMVEESARHAGHLDILREQLDGRTGD
jgi:uncharacterized damage-inducible protein DinB